MENHIKKEFKTRIGVFAQRQILCVSLHALQAGHSDAPPPPPNLDDRKSLSIAFLAISDQYTTLFYFFFLKMAAGGHFEIPKITFDRISRHFRSMHNFYLFFHKIQIYMFTYIMTINNIETIYSQVVIFLSR